jgi:uncharacterized protein
MPKETASFAPFEKEGVRGFLHMPASGPKRGLVLTHGAGGNCSSEPLVKVADAFQKAGLAVLRCDLPYRQLRPSGPPPPGKSAADRAGLKLALAALRAIVKGDVYLGGHSYGGRQASMLVAGEPALSAGLLLLAYPLHPPNKPEQMRTDHFPKLKTAAVFVHGTADPFASTEEMETALALIPAPTKLVEIDGAGHDLAKGRFDIDRVVAALLT